MHQASQRYALRNSYVLSRGRFAGLGTGNPGQPSTTQMVQQVGSIATGATTAALSATSAASIAAGGSGLILGLAPALAIPLIGAAIAGITIGIVAILNSGCGQTCIVTSNWANQAADLLEQNIKAYFALPAPRPVEAKAQALANFDNVWKYLSQQCGSPALGQAGVNCIQDRMAGACKWHQTGQPEFPGQPENGACWNWFNSYRDPIAADPAVITEATVDPNAVLTGGTTPTVGASTTVGGIDLSTVGLFAGIGLLAFGLLGSK